MKLPAQDTSPDVEAYLQHVEQRYRRIAGQISPIELQLEARGPLSSPPGPGADPLDLAFAFTLTEDDLLGGGGGSRLFAGYYSRDGLAAALSRYGLLGQIARAVGCGEADLALSIDTGDPFHHALHIHRGHRGAPSPEHLLVELRVHLQDQPCEAGPGFAQLVPADRYAGYVACEWLLLQRPGHPFPPDRQRLPGQLHPGLGVGVEVQTLLWLMTERLRRHGLLAYPAFYHTAAMYAVRFHFVDPVAEGRFRALRRDGAGLPLAALSWAVELGCVREAGAQAPFSWLAHEEMLPVSPAAQAYFAREEYALRCAEAEAGTRFVIDQALLARRRPAAEQEAEALSLRAREAARAAWPRGGR